MQSLRIIQRCDHTKKIEEEIIEVASIYRQEVRKSVILKPYSNKISYHGYWIENKDDKGEVISKTNADSEARCAVFFYGDDVTIYASANDFKGPVYVYLDGKLVDIVNEATNIDKKGHFPVAAIAELDYTAHVVELAFNENFVPASNLRLFAKRATTTNIQSNSNNSQVALTNGNLSVPNSVIYDKNSKNLLIPNTIYSQDTKNLKIISANSNLVVPGPVTYDKNTKNLLIPNAIYEQDTKNLKIFNSSEDEPRMSITKIFCSEILIGNIEDSDVVSQTDIIKEITRVYQGDEGKPDYQEFIEYQDYELFGGNKIRWLGKSRPHTHSEYYVEYVKKEITYKTFLPDECEKCYGLEWYGCLQNLTTNQPSRATGIERITEDIIKFILTPYNEATGYGSEFLNLLKNNYVELDDLETYATAEVERIVNAYKTLQTNEILNGASYNNEDILDNINIEDISFDVNELRLFLALTVSNKNGQEVNVEEAFEL